MRRTDTRVTMVTGHSPLCLAKYLPRTMRAHRMANITTATTPPMTAWSTERCTPSPALESDTHTHKHTHTHTHTHTDTHTHTLALSTTGSGLRSYIFTQMPKYHLVFSHCEC